jgi:hypothetical protein
MCHPRTTIQEKHFDARIIPYAFRPYFEIFSVGFDGDELNASILYPLFSAGEIAGCGF